ncbi:MAG: glycerate kinase [Candidatus Hermodarchaeota archaeon]
MNSYIKNRSELLPKSLDKYLNELRESALNALDIALDAVRPENLIKKSLKIQNNNLSIFNDCFDLNNYDRVYIIGGGKASALMLIELERILKNSSTLPYHGIINVPESFNVTSYKFSGKIKLNFATHPIPNENGVNGTRKMMEFIKQSSSKDLFICLISGGGSALLPLPKEGLSLVGLQKINSLLLASGASIHEINTIRKHLSDFKGGNLAKHLYHSSEATLISLIISDVVGDDLDAIASGPTVPDKTTYKNAIDILKKYNIYEKIPESAKKILLQGLKDSTQENPKKNDPCFNRVHNYLIGSVKSAVKAVSKHLEKRYHINYFSNSITGEAREFGAQLYLIISKKLDELNTTNKIGNLALIGSGELTVTIKGDGIGGRNQEMLLSFLERIKNSNLNYNLTIIGANLDGIEGNSKAMGALIDNFTLKHIQKQEININKYLNNNDSNTLFKEISSEIITGATGCNVNDILLILISKSIKNGTRNI